MQLISVIIPVYNRVHLLPRVLESIKNQTYKNIEVIIVDDGSRDSFRLSDFGLQNDETVKLIRQKNMGAPVARNRGLAEAKGEYVIFWDADVIGKPEMLERLERPLQDNLKLSFSYCNYHLSFIIYHLLKKMRACEFNFEKLNQSNYIHSTSLIRREDMIKWDESLKRFQDWDLWLTMAEQDKKGVWVDEYLFTVLSGGTMSGWLPRIAYKAPFKWLPGIARRVRLYEEAKKVVELKHKNI